VSFAAITLCVASQQVFIIVVVAAYFVIDSVRKLLDTPSYFSTQNMNSIQKLAKIKRRMIMDVHTSEQWPWYENCCQLTDYDRFNTVHLRSNQR
jgi:hypothetical protein